MHISMLSTNIIFSTLDRLDRFLIQYNMVMNPFENYKFDYSVNFVRTTTHHDFCEGVHSVLSESYYYESAYDFDFEPGVMVADSCGQCYYKDMKYVSGKNGGTWKCTEKCKALKQFEVDAVLEIKSHFESE